MDKLKPCPFCGAYPKLTHWTYPRGKAAWEIQCLGCEFSMERDYKRELFRAWNKRAGR